VESQEATGMRVLGQFRNLDDPDEFVWLRSFPGMAARHASLTAFYSGPVWRANSAAANATMVDVSNVLLLTPVGADFPLPWHRVDSTETAVLYIAITTAQPRPDPDTIGVMRTLHEENTYPALPVRTGADVFCELRRTPRAGGELLRLTPTTRSLLR
jgi:hypothetical protein